MPVIIARRMLKFTDKTVDNEDESLQKSESPVVRKSESMTESRKVWKTLRKIELYENSFRLSDFPTFWL